MNREVGKKIIPLSGYSFADRLLERSRIEPGGTAQFRIRGQRIGARIMKAAGNEFVGRHFILKVT